MSPVGILLQIIGGVCLLLWGVGMVSKGLNQAFGSALRRIISNSTSNRFKASAIGLFVAALLQSSTAAVLVVSSFAARNVITISAAIAVVLGADVGTTLAAQLMSLNLMWLTPVLLISGYAVNKAFSGSLYKYIGNALIGVGLALTALSMITSAAAPLEQSKALHALIAPMNDQPVLAVLIAALLTWLAHSSLGMVLLLMSFVSAHTIPVKLGLYMVAGANLGGAVAPVVMTLRDIPAGRRIPLGNLFIRAIGVVLAVPLMNVAILPAMAHIHSSPAREIVNFHTLFNLALAVVFLPFIGPMTRLSELVLPDKPREEDESLPRYLDPSAVDMPVAALAGVARETLRLSDIVQKMLQDTLEALRSNNPRRVQDICAKEEDVDSLYEAIKTYLARLDVKKFDEKENARYLQILTFSTNLEHIGDIIDKNLMELARKKIRHQDNFSRQGFAEISDLHSRVMESLQLAQNIFMTGDVKMARMLLEEKENLRSYEMHAAESHFRRLSEGVAETIATSSLHLDILRDLRRINSYLTLIAYPILEDAHQLNASLLKPKPVQAAKSKTTTKTSKPAPDAPLPEKY